MGSEQFYATAAQVLPTLAVTMVEGGLITQRRPYDMLGMSWLHHDADERATLRDSFFDLVGHRLPVSFVPAGLRPCRGPLSGRPSPWSAAPSSSANSPP